MILDVKLFRQKERDLHISHQEKIIQQLSNFLTNKGYVLCNFLGCVDGVPTQASDDSVNFLKNIPDSRSLPDPKEPWRLPFVATISGLETGHDSWTMAINGTEYLKEMLFLGEEISANFNVRVRCTYNDKRNALQSFSDDPDPYENLDDDL